MKKEEAEAKLKESQRVQCEKFCPIILNNCKQNCVCFNKGKVRNYTFAGKTDYTINSANCTHSLINNHMYITKEDL